MADLRETLLANAKVALEAVGVALHGEASITVDEYGVANQDSETSLYSGHPQRRRGQAFELSAAAAVSTVALYLKKSGLPTGTAMIELFAATGDAGTAVPTGSALASGTLDVSTLTTSFVLTEVALSSSLMLTAGWYVVTAAYPGGDISNRINLGRDGSSPTHAGHTVAQALADDSWAAGAGVDYIFAVMGPGYTAKPSGLNVYRHRTRDYDLSKLPDCSVFYMGEAAELEERSSTGVSERAVRLGVLCRAKATSAQTGDEALIPLLQWAELALLLSDYTVSGAAANGRLERIDPIEAQEQADVVAEALMQFIYTVRTARWDPRTAP